MRHRRGFKKASSNIVNDGELPLALIETLEQLEDGAIILDGTDSPIFASSKINDLGILREGRIVSHELLASIRVSRRTQTRHEGIFQIARGPIGDGKRDLTIIVSPLSQSKLVLVLVKDESEVVRVDAIRRDFVANVSHELKTPISALSLLSEAVLSAIDEPETIKKFALRMQSEAKRLTDLVQEIINLSRLQDTDPLQVAFEFDISDVINVAISQCATNAEARNISLTTGAFENATISGNRDQIIMALTNLIDNAINYSPDGTKVAIAATVETSIVTISVTDQGIGISESEQARIFERFYRVDPARSRQTGGTGLGLSIVKHVANRHGGDISVWSTLGVGSTFSIRFPIATSEPELEEDK
jgi:two-component system sensor histidine kinase SenX3